MYVSIYIYVYIYAVQLKTGPILPFFMLKLVHFLVLIIENIILRAERREFLKNKQKQQKNTIFKVKNWSNYVAQHAWTSF